MSNEKITCRIAIQVCVGYFPDGRERHRTFSLWRVRPDVTPETIRGIIRALAPLLEYPITKVTKVIKRVIFSAEEERDAEKARRVTAAVPSAAVPAPRVVAGRPAVHRANDIAEYRRTRRARPCGYFRGAHRAYAASLFP